MITSIHELLNAQGHFPRQRFVEYFSGKQISAIWNYSEFATTSTSFVLDDLINGGGIMETTDTSAGEGMLTFNDVQRPFSPTSSVFICESKSNDDASLQNTRVGLKNANSITFNGGQLAGTENGYNVTWISSFCADSAGFNRTNTSLTRDTAWHTFKGELFSSSYVLNVDGVLETTDTDNLPTLKLQPFIYKAYDNLANSSSSVRYFEAYNK